MISRVISRKIHVISRVMISHTALLLLKKKKSAEKKFFNQASDFSVKITRDFFERSVKKKNHSECHIKKNIAEQCMCVLDLAVNFTEKKSNKKI